MSSSRSASSRERRTQAASGERTAPSGNRKPVEESNATPSPFRLAHCRNWKVISAGDFNADGKSDILWQNSTTKAVEVYLMDGTSITNTPAIQATGGLTAVGTGDFNGDGSSDILFKNAAGNAVLWFMQGASRTGTKTITKPGANFTLSGAADVDGAQQLNQEIGRFLERTGMMAPALQGEQKSPKS